MEKRTCLEYHRPFYDVFCEQMLQIATKGHGIVIGSGASEVMELRGPNDVANMATLFGLSVEVAKLAVSKNCE